PHARNHVVPKNYHPQHWRIPQQIGLGTWLSKPHEVENAVEIAVKNGYRHLDLAMIYENQTEVNAALKKVIPSVVKREELHLTSKLWNSSHQPAEVEKELDETLKQLGTPYLDLYLIHWPVAFVLERVSFSSSFQGRRGRTRPQDDTCRHLESNDRSA
ncbi:Aldo/keto reductase, partial [Gymnopus androsaceus JB14]